MARPIFFTDCSNLAMEAAAPGANNHAMLWDIRTQAIEFQNITPSMSARVFHIKREINVVTHHCPSGQASLSCYSFLRELS
jgi:hypothetical protein